ncbi:peroxisome biogenesis factor 10 [Thecaphora frezii]
MRVPLRLATIAPSTIHWPPRTNHPCPRFHSPPPHSPTHAMPSSPRLGALPTFPRATHPSTVRAYQKDAYYEAQFTSHLSSVLLGLLGSRVTHRFTHSISLLGSLAYHFLSSRATQTLGEEYVGSLMVHSGRLVGKKRRTAFILVHILLPFLSSRLYTLLRTSALALQRSRSQRCAREAMRARALKLPPPTASAAWHRTLMQRLVDRIASLPPVSALLEPSSLVAHLGALHLMLFYLGGTFYTLAHRVARVEYITTHPPTAAPSYHILGVLLGIQLLVKLGLCLRTCPPSSHSPVSIDSHPVPRSELVDPHVKPQPTIPPLPLVYPNDAVASQSLTCTLCIDHRHPELGQSAVTECGHTFCWDCIVSWVAEKPECPLCRTPVHLAHLLPVYNF